MLSTKHVFVVVTCMLLSGGMFRTSRAQAAEDIGGEDTREDVDCPIDVVLVGATGNLAKKYLWTSIFQLSRDTPLRLYPGSRDDATRGQNKVDDVLFQNVSCGEMSEDICDAARDEFVEDVVRPYVQLKRDEDYRLLSEIIERDVRKSCSAGRLFYLAVPPSAYASIARAIHESARPSQGWLRVIFEKPFGSDYDSAKIMADNLSQYLREDEIYRIDHYLGKQALQGFATFLSANADTLGNVMNSRHVLQIEVAMMETEDCKGRTNFYDKYGVLRDVFQNHLTEMVSIVLASEPTNPDSRYDTLIHMNVPKSTDAVLGQYDTYQRHVDEDRRARGESQGARTTTPTCARVRLRPTHTSERWRGVPIYLYSGKAAWNTKNGIIRVTFKNRGWLQVTLQGKHGPGKIEYENVPTIGDDVLVTPGTGWRGIDRGFQIVKKRNAYDVLVEAALNGQTEHFVSTRRLMKSWRLWTPLLKTTKRHMPTTYIAGKNRDALCHPPTGHPWEHGEL